MANDLVERLRHFAKLFGSTSKPTIDEAAARIEELEAALEPFSCNGSDCACNTIGGEESVSTCRHYQVSKIIVQKVKLHGPDCPCTMCT